MIIDCGHCSARGDACADCVVTCLLGPPGAGLEIDEAEQAALVVLAESGLVPPLRLAPPVRRAAGERR